MIQNDLPQGVLSEEKYQAQRKKLKTIALCLISLGVLVSLAIVIGILTSRANEKNSRDDTIAAYEARFQEETAAHQANYEAVQSEANALAAKIDAEKQAVLADYDLLSLFQIRSYELELKKVDQKYQAEISAMEKRVEKLGFGVKFECGTTKKCSIRDPFGETEKFTISNHGSDKLKELETDAAKAKFYNNAASNSSIMQVVAPAIMPLMFFGMAGAMVLMFAHKRDIAAHVTQAGLPVATEGIGKGIKALDDNGTLDIIATTGAKILGKSADAQRYHKVPEKQAKLKKAEVDAMNKTGATTTAAKQTGVFAEQIGKGLKKGLKN